MENEIEKLINLRHLCISDPIGFVLPIDSENPHGLKIIRFYLQSFLLAAILSVAGCSILAQTLVTRASHRKKKYTVLSCLLNIFFSAFTAYPESSFPFQKNRLQEIGRKPSQKRLDSKEKLTNTLKALS
jgi:hypothetical protein